MQSGNPYNISIFQTASQLTGKDADSGYREHAAGRTRGLIAMSRGWKFRSENLKLELK